MSTRLQKVAGLLKVEISEIVQREMKDPRIGFVSVTDVEVSPDLRHARVFLSIMGDEDKKKSGLKILKGAAGYIRGELGKRIRMRMVPELDFRMDESIERGARMFELLKQIEKNESDKE